MAQISITRSNVTLSLSTLEKVGGLLRDLSVPRNAVVSATAVDDGLKALRGLRAPGLGLPWVRAIGTWRGKGYRDWVSVGRGPAVVLELKDQKFARAVVSVADAAKVAAELS
jgi:hypothetical protein